MTDLDWTEKPHTHGGTDCGGGIGCPAVREAVTAPVSQPEQQQWMISHLPVAMREDKRALETYADMLIQVHMPRWERVTSLIIRTHYEHPHMAEGRTTAHMVSIEFTIQRKQANANEDQGSREAHGVEDTGEATG